MRNKRATTIVWSFLAITLMVIFVSINIQVEIENQVEPLEVEAIETTTFKGIHYYVLKNDLKEITVNAETINIFGKESADFLSPIGTVYQGEKEIDFVSKRGFYDFKAEKLRLVGKVKLSNTQGTHYTDELLYELSKGELTASGNVKSLFIDESTKDKMELSSENMKGWDEEKRLRFSGSVTGELTRNKKYEPGYNFTTRELEYFGQNSFMELQGDVKLVRNNYHLQGQKAEIFLENYNKKLKYYVMYDDIKLEEKLKMRQGGSQMRRAFAEKLEGFISDGKLVLSGAPRVEQGRDIIKGYQITLRENTEIVEVDDSQSSFRFKKEND